MKPKHPRDPIQLAKAIGDLATGQTTEPPESARSKGSRMGGLKGGAARAKSLTAEQRAEIAKTAAMVRWKKSRP